MTSRDLLDSDFPAALAIINAAAEAYRGVIPDDCWHEPYMSAAALAAEIAAGVVFRVIERDDRLTAVMGLQDKGDVVLVRHAYVAPDAQRGGLGTQLLREMERLVDKPILIGTWADADWAVDFYRRSGFTLVSPDEKDRLLRTYWSIPARQRETSIVLADRRWMERARSGM